MAFVLHHVLLAMPEGGEERARAFYAEVLGLEEIIKPEALAAMGGVWFRHGTLEIHLGVEEPFSPARKAHPGILVQDLEALSTAIDDAGGEVAYDDSFPGFARFYTADWFGNRLEFLARV